ncbi:two-component system sensor histidine kinase NtrB [Halarchaeum nitratireducens]|nr:PAS domain S-box protein [Halarchaeum nitratireducens]
MSDAEERVGSPMFDESGNVEPGVLDKDFFEVLVENGSDAIVSIDEQSRILFANRSVERVFGYEPEELVGEPLTKIMPERFRDAHHAAIDAYLETGERTLDWQNVELPARHKDGHEVQLSITFEEHHYDGRRVFSGIMRDITERVERERELQRQNEQLERFASIVSHDLRDPLQTAKADVAILESQPDDGDELLAELDDTLDRMDELIEDVLTLAKQGESIGDTARVPLERVVKDAWRTAGTDAATLDVEGDLLAVKADRERFETLLQNLFRNAVEHGGDDVTVRVGLLDDGFYVEDDGPGIPADALDDLFAYGFTTSDTGTGFGLSIVEQIADAHGWSVEASTGERGARFEFHDVTMS